MMILFRTIYVFIFLQLVNSVISDDTECEPDEFRCSNGNCINIAWKCDQFDDCKDNSDEVGCPATTCPSEHFKCAKDKGCIPKRWLCDGGEDCDDGSDEEEHFCAGLANIVECDTTDNYKCNASKECIPNDWKCDNSPDCPQGDDEKDCLTKCDDDSEFMCSDGKCISNVWRCDGSNECPDGSDEKDCEIPACQGGEWKCNNGECINESFLCDGDHDCEDKSDEKNCTTKDLERLEQEQTCAPSEFKCHEPALGSVCLHFAWKCDGDTDCDDGSDELECPEITCKPGEKRCGTLNYCIMAEFFCDKQEDCTNGADEINCVYNETVCEKDEFYCEDDDKTCIPSSQVCDGNPDCPNKQDESPLNACPETNPCIERNGGCEQVCTIDKTKDKGYRCECHVGYEFKNGSTHVCEDLDECRLPGTCSQTCTNTKGSYKCGCRDGYELTDSRYCKAKKGEPELIFTEKEDIIRYGIRSNKYSELLNPTVSGAVSIDYDYNRNFFYWTDVHNMQVIQASTESTNSQTVIASSETQVPNGLAVDWVHRNLYVTWTPHSNEGEDNIQVVSLDNINHKKVLVTGNMDEPMALVLDPYRGWMYWTDWGINPKIEKCGMNGQERKEIVNTQLIWPNGLTIDYAAERLYWVDAKMHLIGSSNLDGGDYKIVAHSYKDLGHPFAVTVFEDSLYWTDLSNNAVHKIDKFGKKAIEKYDFKVKSPMGINVYHRLRQPTDANYCEKQNGGCSHLCLPKPNAHQNKNAGHECACPNDMVLIKGIDCVLHDEAKTLPNTDEGKKLAPPSVVEVSTNNEVEKAIYYHPQVTTDSSDEDKSNVTNSKQKQDNDGASGRVAMIAVGAVALIFICVGAVVYLLVRRHKKKNIKTMNFDNPIYRKTTTDDKLMIERNIQHGSENIQSLQPLNQEPEIVV